jgi:hypothetical protein
MGLTSTLEVVAGAIGRDLSSMVEWILLVSCSAFKGSLHRRAEFELWSHGRGNSSDPRYT